MNKVKFNRFEKYIPEPDKDGILTVSSNEEGLEYKPIENLNRNYGRDNLINGFKLSLNNNVFTIGTGQLLAYTKRAYDFNVQNNIASIKVSEPFWGVLSNEQFDIGEYSFNIENHYTEENLCGADYSESVYNIPVMSSNNQPYGVASSNSPHSSNDYAPWRALSKSTSGSFCFASADVAGAPFPVTFNYSISANYDKWVKPTSFYIQNRNTTGAGIASPQVFYIQGSKILHPYDDADWETILYVDNVNLVQPTGQNASKTYEVSTSEYYRHFRLYIISKSTTANYVAIQQFNINGITTDIIPILNPIHNYFMIKAKNKETQEIKTGFVTSKSNIPVLDDTLELLDYYPIKESFMNINDYNDTVYINKTIEDTVDVSESIVPNTEYRIWFVENDNEYTYVVESDNQIPYNKRCRLLGKFKTNEDNIIINYYPRNEISKLFEDRFIIAEQLGTTGYRIYSDGYKEQWGNLVNPIFPIAFDNIPVDVERGATALSKTGMTLAAGYWTVKGY